LPQGLWDKRKQFIQVEVPLREVEDVNSRKDDPVTKQVAATNKASKLEDGNPREV
jgi:hypothetical protein